MMTHYLVLTMLLAGVPAPAIFVPMSSAQQCEAAAKAAGVSVVKDKSGRPVVRLKARCMRAV